MTVADIVDNWVCPLCGAGKVFTEITPKYAKTAPRWHGWPVPPPPEFDERILVGSDILIRCANEHGFTYFEYAEMKVNDD